MKRLGTSFLYALGIVWALPSTLVALCLAAGAGATMTWHPRLHAIVAVPEPDSRLAALMVANKIGGTSIGNVVFFLHSWYVGEQRIAEAEAHSVRMKMLGGPLGLAIDVVFYLRLIIVALMATEGNQ